MFCYLSLTFYKSMCKEANTESWDWDNDCVIECCDSNCSGAWISEIISSNGLIACFLLSAIIWFFKAAAPNEFVKWKSIGFELTYCSITFSFPIETFLNNGSSSFAELILCENIRYIFGSSFLLDCFFSINGYYAAIFSYSE